MDFLLENVRRVVIKLGTNILTRGGGRMEVERVQDLCAQIASLRKRNVDVIIVSSGAVGLGMGRLGLTRRPTELATLQACAAIGQTLLMETWQKSLQAHDITCAQILLTHEDVRHRNRHLAVTNTLERLLKLGVVPVVNENDTVSVAELKFGDNDILSALTASLAKADLLVILSTVPGLIDRTGTGEIVPVVREITPEIRAMAGGTDSPTAVGGMISKIDAARVATRSGCGVFIGNGADPVIIMHLLNGRAEGTFFVPSNLPLDSRKRWIAFFETPRGKIRVDAGAATALRTNGRSLLAKGVKSVTGEFPDHSVVEIEDEDGRLVARGVTGFGSAEIASIAGKESSAIRAQFPGRRRFEIIHRNALVLLG